MAENRAYGGLVSRGNREDVQVRSAQSASLHGQQNVVFILNAGHRPILEFQAPVTHEDRDSHQFVGHSPLRQSFRDRLEWRLVKDFNSDPERVQQESPGRKPWERGHS